MLEIFHKFIDNEINLSEFEEIIYENTLLEKGIGTDNYQYFLEFNYKTKYAKIEIQDYILNYITTKIDFGVWKLNRLLQSNNIYFPNENLFEYAKKKIQSF